MEIALKPKHEKLLADWVSSGKFASVEEAVETILEARARDEEKLEWLRREIQEGADQLDRGEYIELSTPADFKAFANEIHQKGLRRLAAKREAAAKR